MPNQHDSARSPELIEAMAQAYAERGERTVGQIAASFGETPSAFRHALSRAKRLVTKTYRAPLSPAEQARIVELWPTSTCREIARQIGRDEETISKRARTLGLAPHRQKLTTDEVIRAAILAGMTNSEGRIKLKVGSPRWVAIRRQMAAEGLIPEHPKNSGREARNADIVRRLQAGDTTSAICAAIGVKPNIVWHVANQQGLSIQRPQRESKANTARSRPSNLILGPGASMEVRPPLRVVDETPPADAKPLELLKDDVCRWPYGQRHAVVYCGAPVLNPADRRVHGRYCAHHRMASVA